jgi:hypothetical protein
MILAGLTFCGALQILKDLPMRGLLMSGLLTCGLLWKSALQGRVRR